MMSVLSTTNKFLKMEPTASYGGVLDKYTWSQTLSDVTIVIPIGSTIRAKHIDCKIQPNHLAVRIFGEEEPIINGKLFNRIKVENSTWTIDDEDSRVLRIDLYKNEGQKWWPCVIDGDPTIDTTRIDPSPISLDSLDTNIASEVQKYMASGNLTTQGPKLQRPNDSLSQEEKSNILKQFMSQHPEMDFSSAVVE